MKSATESKFFSTNKTLSVKGKLVDLARPKIMGILNVTPDSFYDGGRFVNEMQMMNQVEKMLSEGAAFIDVGAYSSRPGAADITVEEERERALRAIRAIVKRFPEAIVSIDTFRSEVARAAIGEGAAMINDISGGELDDRMFETAGSLNVPYILMHMRGTPKTMTSLVEYDNIIGEIIQYLQGRIVALHQCGVADVIVDPGFGFAKTGQQNFYLLRHLSTFRMLEKPLLVGLSRKSMIWRTLGITAEEALNGTTALHAVALFNGASILRVHDVKEASEVVKLISQINPQGY